MSYAPQLGAVAAIAAAASALAVTANGQPAPAPGPATLHVIEKKTSFTLVDTGRKGESRGDLGVLAGNLLDAADGHKIGRFQGVCVVIKPAAGNTQCTFTLSLPDGQITTQAGYGAGFNGNKVVHEAVVGGTDSYSDARGQVISEETGQTTGRLTIELAG
jgi:hypothetical protein